MAGRFQFSIRWMLVATAVIGAAVAAIHAEPTGLACLALMLLNAVFLTIAIVACLQTTGAIRSFWVGMLVALSLAGIASMFIPIWYAIAWAPAWLEFASQKKAFNEIGETVGRVATIFWCFAPLNGLLGMFVHCLFWRSRNKPPLPPAVVS